MDLRNEKIAMGIYVEVLTQDQFNHAKLNSNISFSVFHLYVPLNALASLQTAVLHFDQ